MSPLVRKTLLQPGVRDGGRITQRRSGGEVLASIGFEAITNAGSGMLRSPRESGGSALGSCVLGRKTTGVRTGEVDQGDRGTAPFDSTIGKKPRRRYPSTRFPPGEEVRGKEAPG